MIKMTVSCLDSYKGGKKMLKEKEKKEKPISKLEEGKDRFFAICDNCDTKVYKHQGYREHPEGVYNIFATCPECDNQFNHVIRSKQGKAKMTADKQTPVVKQILENLNMGHFFDNKKGGDDKK